MRAILPSNSGMAPHASGFIRPGREGKGREEEGKGSFDGSQVQIVKAVEGQRLDGLVL